MKIFLGQALQHKKNTPLQNLERGTLILVKTIA